MTASNSSYPQSGLLRTALSLVMVLGLSVGVGACGDSEEGNTLGQTDAGSGAALLAIDDSYQASEGSTLIIGVEDGVLANDVVNTAFVEELRVVMQPSHGTLEMENDGSFSYTVEEGFSGFDSFAYQFFSDGETSNQAIATIEVLDGNHAPTVSSSTYTTDEDIVLSVVADEGLLRDAFDVDGDEFSVSLQSDPEHGDLILRPDGSFDYAPDADYFGVDVIAFTVIDAAGAAAQATLTVEVLGVSDAPVATGDYYEVSEDSSMFVAASDGVASNDIDRDGDTLSVVLITGPSSGSLELFGDGSFSYNPLPDFFGIETFQYTASDGSLSSDVVDVEIAVIGVNDEPVGAIDSYAGVEDEELTVSTLQGVLANDTDADGDSLIATVSTPPGNGSLTLDGTGAFTYQPNENFFGEDSFSYTVSDGMGSASPTLVNLAVEGQNDRPISVASFATTKENRTVLGSVDIFDLDADELIHSVVESPTNGVLVLAPDTGEYSYTPDLGFVGRDTFSSRAYDGALMSPAAIVTVDVRPLPTITELLPARGSTGQPLQLRGEGFGTDPGTVLFNGQAISAINWSDSHVAIEIPRDLARGSYDVVLTDSDGDETTTFSYEVVPWLATVLPGEASPGSTVVLAGDALGTAPGSVRIGGVDATIVSWANTEVSAVVPENLQGAEHGIILETAEAVEANRSAMVVRGADMWITDPLPKYAYRADLVWTGTEAMVVGYTGVVGRYNPDLDSWTQMSDSGSPHYREGERGVVWTGDRVLVLGNGGGVNYDPQQNRWRANGTTGLQQWAQSDFSTIWTGTEAIVWGGGGTNRGQRYNPSSRLWAPTSLADAPVGRTDHTAVWTGETMIVWGGRGATGALDEGMRYDPVADTWAPISTDGAPAARYEHFAAWTGREMLVLGGRNTTGRLADGAAYNPETDTWRVINPQGAPAPANFSEMIWTGKELMVLPLESNSDLPGALYDPVEDRWRAMSNPLSRASGWGNASAWTGREVVFFDGNFETTYRYDPQADVWARGAGELFEGEDLDYVLWTGSEFLVWGGNSSNGPRGLRYHPSTKAWSPMSALGAPPESLRNATAVWSGSEMLIWGGSPSGLNFTEEGWRYNPTTDSWSSMNTLGAPLRRSAHSAVWSGTEMLIWGGVGFLNYADGGRYNPETDTWASISTVDGPDPRLHQSAVWTGSEMLIWGGRESDGSIPSQGYRYEPTTDSWLPIGTDGAPAARYNHSTVWTGTAMFIWGGYDGEAQNTGALYSPATDSWATISTIGAPTARSGHSAVWTGTEMFIWGGASLANERPVYRYSLDADTWSTSSTRNAPRGRRGHTAVWTGNTMLLWGGNSSYKHLREYLP